MDLFYFEFVGCCCCLHAFEFSTLGNMDIWKTIWDPGVDFIKEKNYG